MWIHLEDEKLHAIAGALECFHASNTDKLAAEIRNKLMEAQEEETLRVAFVDAAGKHGSDGDLEFDDNAAISLSDDGGAYVMGWKWVEYRELEPTVCAQCHEQKPICQYCKDDGEWYCADCCPKKADHNDSPELDDEEDE